MPKNKNTQSGSHQPAEDAFRAPNKAPARDTQDNPTTNPDGAGKGQAPLTPKPHPPSTSTGRIIREAEPAGTPIERKDPTDGGKTPTVPKTSSAPKPAADAERANVLPGTPIPRRDPFHDDQGNPVPIPDMDLPSTES